MCVQWTVCVCVWEGTPVEDGWMSVTLKASGVISCQAGLDASEIDNSWCDLLFRRVGMCVWCDLPRLVWRIYFMF